MVYCLIFSERRRWVRDLWQIRCRTNGSSSFIRGTPDRCVSGLDDRTPSAEELRAAASRAIAVVGGTRRVCSLHDLRGYVQSYASGLSMTRGQLRVRSTAKLNNNEQRRKTLNERRRASEERSRMMKRWRSSRPKPGEDSVNEWIVL